MFNNIHSARGSTKKTGLRVFNKVLGTNPINYRERHRYYTSHDCACPCRDSWPNNRDACGAGIVAAFCHCAQSYKAFFKKRPNGCRPPNRPIAWQCRFKHWLFKRRSVKTENALESRRPKGRSIWDAGCADSDNSSGRVPFDFHLLALLTRMLFGSAADSPP